MGQPNKSQFDVDDRTAAMFLEVAVQFGPESGSNLIADPGTDPELEPGLEPGPEPGADPSAEPGIDPQLDPGTTDTPPVADAGYKIIEKIGEGGMGTVWRAQQLGTGQPVALKALKHALLRQPGAVARFHTEVRLAASLKHPNIARVFDSGLDKLDYFYVMELIEGQPIDKYVATKQHTPRKIVQLMIEVSDAVSFAHTRDIVHLDLKPTNILVSKDGHPHILDFGLAQIVGQSDTHSAYLAGTRGYVASEQTIFGQPLNQRADVFAIGRILQHLLESAPDQGNTHQPDDLQAIIHQATADEQNHRYPTAGDLTRDLKNWLELRPVTAQPKTLRYTSSLWVKRNRKSLTLSILLTALLVFITSGIGLAVIQREAATQQLNIQSEENFYRSTLQYARERLNQGDLQAAQRLLLETDPSSRGWEWHHLASLADQSSHTITLKDTVIRDFTVLQSNRIVCLTSSGNARYITLSDKDWTQTGHSSGTTLPLAISPDAAFVIGLNRKGQSLLQTLDPINNPTPIPLTDSPAIYNTVSPDGRYVLVATNDRELLLFDTKQNIIVHRQTRPKGTIVASFTGDGRSLVWYDEKYRVLNLQTLTVSTMTPTIQDGKAPRSIAAIGNTLYAGMGDGTILKRSLTGIAEASVIAHIPTEITTIAVSPDGKTIACGDRDGTIHLIKNANEPQALLGHTSPITKLMFSPDSHRLYSLSSHGKLKVWDTDWKAVTHQPWPTDNALVYATDAHGRFMAYSSPESITQLFDTLPGLIAPNPDDLQTMKWGGLPTSLALTPDATRLAIADNNRTIGVYNTTAKAHPKEQMMSTQPAYWLSLEYNSTRLAASNSQEVLIWDYQKTELARILETAGPVLWLKPRPGWLAMIRQSPLGYDIEIRDIDADVLILRESLGTDSIIAMAAATDAARIATLDSAGRVQLLDLHDRRIITTLSPGDVGPVLAVAMTPDGSRVATAGNNMLIWSADSGELLDVIEERTKGPLMSIRFTDDGRDLIGQGLTGYYKWRTR